MAEIIRRMGREGPADPLNQYQVLEVSGYGIKLRFVTTDLMTLDEKLAKLDELEYELRELVSDGAYILVAAAAERQPAIPRQSAAAQE